MSAAKILVVEDEALTALEIQSKLELWGYEVIDIVSSGEDAVEKALEMKPDLILMDIMLRGDISGIEAAKLIKEKMDISLIYLTAYCNPETFQGAKITQPHAYLIKPFEENELKFAIEMAFYGHSVQSKLIKSEALYRNLAENAEDMIFVINNDFTVSYANISALKYLKRSISEVRGMLIEQLFPEDVAKRQRKSLQDIFANGNSKRYESLIVFPDCEIRLDTRLVPLTNDNGHVYAVLGTSREISKKNM